MGCSQVSLVPACALVYCKWEFNVYLRHGVPEGFLASSNDVTISQMVSILNAKTGSPKDYLVFLIHYWAMRSAQWLNQKSQIQLCSFRLCITSGSGSMKKNKTKTSTFYLRWFVLISRLVQLKILNRWNKHCSPMDESRLRQRSCSWLSVHLSCRGLDPAKWTAGHSFAPLLAHTPTWSSGKLVNPWMFRQITDGEWKSRCGILHAVLDAVRR